jgi:excisionase family DNA binding protein
MANLTYSISEISEQLGISRGLAYEMARTGQIPVIRINKRLLVPKDAFEKWMIDAVDGGSVTDRDSTDQERIHKG